MIGRLSLGVWLGAIPSCGDDGGSTIGRTPPPPATTGAASGSTSLPAGTTAGEVVCESTADCDADQACAADYAVGDPAPPEDAFTCRQSCVPVVAVALWCRDDASCCEGTCGDDGTCRGQAPETGSTTTASSGSGESSDRGDSGSSAAGSSSSTG